LSAPLIACQSNAAFSTQLQAQAIVPGSAQGMLELPTLTGLTNIDFNRNSDFRAQGITKENVVSAVADSIQLQILSPDTQDFRFLDSLQVLATASALPDALLARKSSIGQLNLPPPRPTLTLDATGMQLKGYVTAPSMSIVVRGSGSAPPSDTQISVKIGMEIEFK
jgi:hypothetical protein